MKIGVPRETTPGERRVALVPDMISRLTKSGMQFLVESGAGDGAMFSDRTYEEAGATVIDTASLYDQTDLMVKVQPPTLDEADRIRAETTLIGFLSPLVNWQLAHRLAERKVTSFSMELVPRITRAQSMDALSSMSTIAGYRAVLMAAQELPKFFPMLVTAAGTLPPAKALILGAGVAGLQAIASARRIGAVVSAFDVRPVVKEQVESLGAKFLEVEISKDTQDEGGYAKALDQEAERRVEELVAKNLPAMDVVITTALIPGRPAPRLITEEMVRSMKPGSVIVDLAAEAGGNCALTRPGEHVIENGVNILGPLNLPATMPVHASQMYSKNVSSLLQLLVQEGELKLDWEDEIVKGACLTHDGRVIHDRTRSLVEAETSGRASG